MNTEVELIIIVAGIRTSDRSIVILLPNHEVVLAIVKSESSFVTWVACNLVRVCDLDILYPAWLLYTLFGFSVTWQVLDLGNVIWLQIPSSELKMGTT